MQDASLSCPNCGSSDIRRSRRQGSAELTKMLVGNYPFRCLACNTRFWSNIWLLSAWKYAKCPKCLSLNLTSWPLRSSRPNFFQKLCVTLGAKRHRCTKCRCNFVSPRSRYPQPQKAEADIAPETLPAQAAAPPSEAAL